MARPILSAFADEYKTDFDGQLEGLNSFGIDFIELRFVNGTNVAALTDEEVKTVKNKLSAKNIRVSAIGSPLGKINTADDMDAEMAKAERVFKIANELEAKNIRMFSFYLDEKKSKEENKSIVFSSLERMVKLASKYGVTLCHENEAKIYGESPKACREILDYFGGEMKCVFDMGNFMLENFKPYPDAYELLKEYIEYFHIKDSLSAGAIVPPGCGEGQIAELIDAHSAYANNDFFITLEPHLQTFSGLNSLVGKGFDNPYKYETPELAFTDAVNKIKAIMKA
ncbi:MAG: sugar phosphate isomerase/epimerase [Ruminococcaceae bacterium]|nr:sugar phosphate isomerase/epimerase [Oscillospiraceae bacterium]